MFGNFCARDRARQLLCDRRGNVVITFAVSLFVIVGAIGLGADAASWYSTKRAMQNAADLAAAGAINSLKSYYPSGTATTAGYAKNEGKSAAKLHGFVDGVGGTAVSIQIKGVDSAIYSSTNYSSAPSYGAAEAVITQPAPLEFASLFLSLSPTIVARAVTILQASSGDCMLALNPAAAKAFSLQGNTTLNVPCGLADASCNADAFDVTGGAATITSPGLRICGNKSGNSNVFAHVSVTTGDQSITDPYAGRTMPTLGSGYPSGSTWPSTKLRTASPAYTYTPAGGKISASINSTTMFPFGCNSGCEINGSVGAANGNGQFSGATLTLGPGVYFVTGSIWLGSNSSIVSNGATIVLTNSSASSIGTFSMGANSTVTMLAPSSKVGDPGYLATQNFSGVAGVALFQDPRTTESTLKQNGNCNSNCSVFQGGASSTVNGAIYFPKGNLTWQGGPATTNCLQLIADTLTLAGNPGINVGGCTQGEQLFGPTTVAMVE